MNRFDYAEPTTLNEAVSLLTRINGTVNLLAGGTDLLVEIKEQLRRPDYVINIKKISGMDGLRFDAKDGLRLGALVTMRQVEMSPVIREKYPALRQSVSEVGSIQIRNRATLAGNICRASPSADTLPPLIADRASVRIFGPDGERVIPLEEFFTGPGKTLLKSNEILTSIIVPPPAPFTGSAYIKLGRRKAMELATVGVAVTLTLAGRTCRDIRIALGAVAPTPIRAKRAEAVMLGQPFDQDHIEAAAQTAMEESRPISNVRGSADYRREMVKVLTRRAIQQAAELIR
jgi:carbon-monoxide dehydrogenase medium subunit